MVDVLVGTRAFYAVCINVVLLSTVFMYSFDIYYYPVYDFYLIKIFPVRYWMRRVEGRVMLRLEC